MILLKLLCIQLICVLIIDISGFIDSVKWSVSKWLTKGKIPTTDYRIKPFDCSLCMTWWSCLIYMICIGQVSVFLLAYILFLSIMTPVAKEIIVLIRDICIKVINKIYDIIQ